MATTRQPATRGGRTLTGLSFDTLNAFVGRAQRQAIYAGLRGEEKAYFVNVLRELAEQIATMPKTYETGAAYGITDPIVQLHYFTGSADFYITEKDVDDDGQGQLQAFGLADLFGDGGEMGYISLPEILAAGAELDLHWTPRPLSVVRAARGN